MTTPDLTEPTDGSLTRACLEARNDVNKDFQPFLEQAAQWEPRPIPEDWR